MTALRLLIGLTLLVANPPPAGEWGKVGTCEGPPGPIAEEPVSGWFCHGPDDQLHRMNTIWERME